MSASVTSVTSADRAAGGTPPGPAAAETVPAAAAAAVPAAAAAAAAVSAAAAAAAAAVVVPAAAAVAGHGATTNMQPAGPTHHAAMSIQETLDAQARNITALAAARRSMSGPSGIDQSWMCMSDSGASAFQRHRLAVAVPSPLPGFRGTATWMIAL